SAFLEWPPPRPPRSRALVPYTTLFRSGDGLVRRLPRHGARAIGLQRGMRVQVSPRIEAQHFGIRCDITQGLAQRMQLLVEREARSEEHTSELQSREKLVCRLLLEKKKK